jgi:hypothetical protein
MHYRPTDNALLVMPTPQVDQITDLLTQLVSLHHHTPPRINSCIAAGMHLACLSGATLA